MLPYLCSTLSAGRGGRLLWLVGVCVSAGVCTSTRSHSVNTLPPGEGLLNYFCETDGKRDGRFEMAQGRREEETEELELKKNWLHFY